MMDTVIEAILFLIYIVIGFGHIFICHNEIKNEHRKPIYFIYFLVVWPFILFFYGVVYIFHGAPKE